MEFHVDPTLAEGLKAARVGDIDAALVPLIRADEPRLYLPIARVRGVRVQEVTGPGLPRMLVYTPTRGKGARPAILHSHGGGYMFGRPEASHRRNAMLCRSLGAVVVSVDYRKAPENPYPAALDDMRAAWGWLLASAGSHGIDTARIALIGESAGGGLAAALALALRDESAVQPVFQALIYPMIDDRTATTRPWTGPRPHVWTDRSNAFAWRSYLGREPGGDDVPPLAAPARATDLSGLPPTWIGTGDIDLFAAENLAYASRLIGAVVPCEVMVLPGAYHAFQRQAPDSPVTKRFESAYAGALRTALSRA